MLLHGNQIHTTGHHNTISQYVKVLKRCIRTKDLERGKTLHREAVTVSLHTNKYVASLLIKLYSTCGAMHLAREVFDQMVSPDVVTWTCLILGYVENGNGFEAVRIFNFMGIEPSSVTYIAVLKAYLSEKTSEKQICLRNAVYIHKEITRRGIVSDVALVTTLIDVYCKSGGMDRARDLFDGMVHRNVFTWTALILGYVGNRESVEALKLFSTMDCEPDSFTYVAVLKACGELAGEIGLEMGVFVHRAVKERGYDSEIVLATTLVDMYSKCGRMHLARHVFDSMSRKNVVTWTSLIMGYVEYGESIEALNLFFHMDCPPDSFSYLTALRACTTLVCKEGKLREFCLEKGMAIHRRVRSSGLGSELMIATSILDLYGKCGKMHLARSVFDEMDAKDVVAWTSLILGYVDNGESSIALEMLVAMDCQPNSLTYIAVIKSVGALAGEEPEEKMHYLKKGVALEREIEISGFGTDVMVATALVEMYNRCGSTSHARESFNKIYEPTVVTWNTLMLGYVENGEMEKVFQLFIEMSSEPDSFTFVAVLKASGRLAAVSFGRHVHAEVLKRGVEEEEVLECSLMDFYVRCARLTNADFLFSNMHSPDAVSWNALISGYSTVGDSGRVFVLVKDMGEAGVRMNGVTLLCVLSACSHAGMVEEAREYFHKMVRYDICSTLEHYNCMVDVLCRANRLKEALVIAGTMPFHPNVVTWATLQHYLKF